MTALFNKVDGGGSNISHVYIFRRCFAQPWGFANSEVIYATATDDYPVVFASGKNRKGIYYYDSEKNAWLPVTSDWNTEAAVALAGGADVVMTSSGTEVGFLRFAVDPKIVKEGEVFIVSNNARLDFASVNPSASAIAVQKVSKDYVAILVEVEDGEKKPASKASGTPIKRRKLDNDPHFV